MHYSLLDLAPVAQESDTAQAFRNSLDLARHAEKWGYRRYWLAEHHNMPGIASAATSVVISYVAGGTSKIRVGAGGIMLPNHAPLVIAEQFGTLESLYPGRIDLALGRAPGGDQATARALRRFLGSSGDTFPDDLIELMSYFRPNEAGQRVQAVPGAGLSVPIYLLTISDFYYDGLNRQVARSIQAPPAATPTPTPSPTPSPTATPTATPTPTPPPNQVLPVTFSTTGVYPNTMKVTMSCGTAGATIFYTIGGTIPANPTHTGTTATGSTIKYTGVVNVTSGQHKFFKAVAYKSGMIDSVITQFEADNTSGGGGFAPVRGGAVSMAAPLVTTTTFSVWDGSWALLEEYGPGNVLSETYLQGAHGLVKTMVANIYYYQDELGSTSHIASAAGALLESYRYDLYGKPTYWNPSGVQITASTRNVRDLFTGQRWVPEIGLYDDRNRFMSPDLGRFLQPDPIGFKGDGSNLYRYCHNDWANRSDPMGTTESYTREVKTAHTGDQNRNPDSGSRLGAESAWDRHSSFYARSTKTDHVEAGIHGDTRGIHIGLITESTYREFDTPGRGGAGEAGARDDYEHVKDSGFKIEFGNYICQRNDAKKGGYIALPGKEGAVKYQKETKQKMQTTTLDPKEIPKGYHAVGFHYAHKQHDDYIPQQIDQQRANDRHWGAVLASPPYKGSDPSRPNLIYYPRGY